MKICYTFGGAGLFALSLTASALSLGQSQGQVVLGAPLDLVFQLQPDADMDAASSCVSAEVLLGERRIDASRVNVTPLAQRPGLPASVRLRASVVIDEPVVVVRLSAGCQGLISRSYTFFAELPEAASPGAVPFDIGQLSALPAPPAAAPPAAVAPAARVRPPAAPRRAEPASSASASASATSAAAARAPAAPRPRKPAPKPPEAPAPTAVAVPAGESGLRLEPRLRIDSRLRMEPLETWAAPAAGAAAAAALLSGPLPGAQASADSPAVAAESADQRVLALEAEIQSLKTREVSQSASLARIGSQLEALQAEQQQGSPWTLPLLVALAIMLAVLAWLLLRLRSLAQSAPSGWLQSVDGQGLAMPGAGHAETAFGVAAAASMPGASSVSTFSGAAFRAPQEEGDATEFGPPTVRASAAAEAAAAPVHRHRDVVKPEELFDVRQQAEFFTSVGEYEQAIAVMRKHIAEHQDSSPLAYLELLGLFYQLSRRAEYDALRQQFEQHFAASVPEMAQFAQRGRSLAHYPELLANIEALWPTDEVGELLESYLFRHQGYDSGVLFDLEAFDDLLLLQAVARTTPAGTRGQTTGRRRTTPTAAPVEAPLASAAITAAAAAGSLAAGLVPGDEPWATLERANAPAPAPSSPALVPLPPALDPAPLSLDIPSRFDVPEGPFARSEPLASDTAGADLPAASSLLDIDLSDVGRWQPLDLPAVEPLPFDLEEFPKRPIVGSIADQNVGFNALDPKLSLPDNLELTPWEDDSPDSIFSAWNAARTERVIAKSPPEDGKNDKAEPGSGIS
ncbi:hypothetical protein [Pantoea sp. 18069]|uniref:hypothetical protein n=1 Tax=Pantoea sp. 18069 TaxID=2681415 RepID=UPI001357B334|nr:hypothetical protein [Pantoea sp. 18069]